MTIAALTVVGLYERHIAFGLQTGDSDPPVETVAFAAGAVAHNYLQVVGTATDLNPPVTLYLVALADAAAAPSEAQIVAGTDSTDTPAPRGSNSAESGESVAATVAGLTASTDYDVYYTLGDAFDNYSTAVKLDISTTAAPTYQQNDAVRPIASGSRMVRSVKDDVI